ELFLRLDKISNVQSIMKNAQDLQFAMNTTESAASATIQDLEIQVSRQREMLDRLETVLRDGQATDEVKVEQALTIFDQM
ncbi:MAG: hypothetical protein ACD_75C00588G0002, partial [uncultured bacterium]